MGIQVLSSVVSPAFKVLQESSKNVPKTIFLVFALVACRDSEKANMSVELLEHANITKIDIE